MSFGGYMSTLPDRGEQKKSATKFEEQIKNFLDKLGFIDIDGGKDNFKLGGHQIDAIGGYDKVLMIIECTMKREIGRKSLREKLNAFKSKATAIERECKSHPTYKKYNVFRYAMAIKNIDIGYEDKQLAKQDPIITIWDDDFIEYYEDLYDKINRYAVLNLFGDMGVKPLNKPPISVPAFLTKFGNIEMYSFLINPKELLEVSYVARRGRKSELFYQRSISKERLKDIANYVNDGEILPTNLIITFGEHLSQHVRFHEVPQSNVSKAWSGLSYGYLTFPRDYRSCWIIDGQHRLYAFAKVDDKISYYMPVVAFKKLPIDKQCQIFLDINKNQKPVPADLVWDLNGDIIPEQEDGIISNTVKVLNKWEPLIRKIYIPSSPSSRKEEKCPLKIAGMCLSMKKAKLACRDTVSHTKNFLFDDNPERMWQNLGTGISRYISFIKNKMLDDWERGKKGFILDNYTNGILIRFYEKILSRCASKGRLPTNLDYEKYVTPLTTLLKGKYSDHLELKRLKDSLTSEDARDRFLKDLIWYTRIQTKDNYFGGDIELQSPIAEQILALAKKLREFINTELTQKIGPNWFEDFPEKAIFKKALFHLKQNCGDTDSKKAYTQISLGECKRILKHHQNILYPYFKNQSGFTTDNEIDVVFEFFPRYRLEEVKDVGVSKKLGDDEFFKLYSTKIIKCIETYLSSTEN
jgi:DGQHR domain-containing protein